MSRTSRRTQRKRTSRARGWSQPIGRTSESVAMTVMALCGGWVDLGDAVNLEHVSFKRQHYLGDRDTESICQHAAMARWLHSLRNLISAPSDERRAVVLAIAMTPWFSLRLRRRGLRRTRKWLSDKRSPSFSDQALIRADRAIRRLPWGPTCLDRSLVIWWLGGRRGYLKLGVTRDGRHFHAWVERDGRIINDSPDVRDRYLGFDGEIPDMGLLEG